MLHILLIEPNTVLAAAYVQALQHEGHTVTHVTGAQTGIDAADKHTPGLVLLELQLSLHNGIEFLHEFRSYPEWQAIPVVINTSIIPTVMGESEAILRRDLGVRAVYYKPRTTLEDITNIAREFAQGQ